MVNKSNRRSGRKPKVRQNEPQYLYEYMKVPVTSQIAANKESRLQQIFNSYALLGNLISGYFDEGKNVKIRKAILTIVTYAANPYSVKPVLVTSDKDLNYAATDFDKSSSQIGASETIQYQLNSGISGAIMVKGSPTRCAKYIGTNLWALEQKVNLTSSLNKWIDAYNKATLSALDIYTLNVFLDYEASVTGNLDIYSGYELSIAFDLTQQKTKLAL